MLEQELQVPIDQREIQELWRCESVVRGWVLDVITAALEANQIPTEVANYAAQSGRNCSDIAANLASKVPTPLVTLTFLERFGFRNQNGELKSASSAACLQLGDHVAKQ